MNALKFPLTFLALKSLWEKEAGRQADADEADILTELTEMLNDSYQEGINGEVLSVRVEGDEIARRVLTKGCLLAYNRGRDAAGRAVRYG